MTPSMFGDDRKPVKPPRAKPKPNHLTPWFDAFITLLGPVAVRAAAGRLGQLAKRMEAEGLAPADLARLPAVVKQHAPWRKTFDLATVCTCWVWLVNPPLNLEEPSPLQIMQAGRALNGGADPF